MDDRSSQLPFMCPVPVRRATMMSLHPEHASHAVQTDLARMGGFGVARDVDPSELLYADFQLGSWANSVLRQGSGRSGFYRGHYLKGMGRTPLAANYCDARDWYHGSGHLFPTSAVREYLTTVYMEARGRGDRLVPCRGLLLGRLEPAFRADLVAAFGPAFEELAPIDRELFAITVKPGGFARASNFLWLATRLSGWGEDWRVFLPLMEQYAARDARSPDGCSARTLAAELSRAARRSLDGIASDFDIGVCWNSLWNNTTLDGRVLDLEVATLTCRSFFGATTAFGYGTSAASTPRRLMGLEVIDHAIELASNLTRLASQVKSLLALPLAFETREKQLMIELEEELDRVAKDETLFGVEALCERVLVHLPPRARPEICEYIAERHKAWSEPRLSHVGLERTPIEFRRTEPTVSQALWLPPGEFRREDWDDAEWLGERFEKIASCTDIDRALSAIVEAESEIRKRWKNG